MSILKEIIYSFRQSRGDFDEARDKPYSQSVECHAWLGPLHPVSTDGEYRVTVHHGRYGIEALIKGNFVQMRYYDDGYDDYGKLRPGKWRPVSEACAWRPEELKAIAKELLNGPSDPATVEVIS